MKAHEVNPKDYFEKLPLDRANVLGSWLSKSSLWELTRCSLYKWRYAPPKAPTDSMSRGSLIDILALTPEMESEMVAVLPFKDLRTKEAREWKAEAEQEGLVVTKEEDMETARQAAEVLTSKCEGSAELLAKSGKQVVILGQRRGANLRGLVDIAPAGERYLADLKTTANFSLEGFGKTIATFGYHLQAALYLELWNGQFPDDQREGFHFVWQDVNPPYEVCITEMSAFDLAAGLDLADWLTGRIVWAALYNQWPMLEQGRVPMVGRPMWACISEDEMMAEAVEAPALEVVE